MTILSQFGVQEILTVVIAGAAVVILLGVMIVMLKFARLWVKAVTSSTNISMVSIIGMTLRRIDAKTIVNSKIMAVQAGLDRDCQITTRALEAHYLAGGDVKRVVEALVAASRAGLKMTFPEAIELDLAGQDVIQLVRSGMLIGKTGMARTVIPQRGRVEIDGKVYDALSVDAEIASDQQIEVIGSSDDCLIVKQRQT